MMLEVNSRMGDRGRSPRTATTADAAAIVELRDDLAHRMRACGIEQWNPGEVGFDEVRRQAASGEWHVVADAGAVVGAIRLIWSDPAIWGDIVDPDDTDAGYVHGLMTSPRCRGSGLGGAVLDWAERQMVARGVHASRLDCVASNAALRAYYRDRGYRELGVRDLRNGWYPLMRFERRL